MFEVLLGLTALVLVVTTISAYERSRDVLHPAMFLGPLFLYGAVFDPWLVRENLDRFFREPEQVNRVVLLNLLCVTGLAFGLLHLGSRNARTARYLRRHTPLVSAERKKLRGIAIALSIVALSCYAYGIAAAGGFVAAFSQSKGGGYASSGYIGEAMNLGLAAAIMLALSRHRRGFSAEAIGLLSLALLPNLVQGTFGGRRGPLFLAIATGSLAWFLIRVRKPRLWMLGGCLAVACLAVMFVWSQRRHMHLGSENPSVQWDEFIGTLTQSETVAGNSFIYGAAYVLTMEDSGKFTWGKALAVDLLVRPVPRQIWPTKYADVGATWIVSQYPGLGPLDPQDWLATVGWLPLGGSAAISIADVFGEFGWGAIVVFYLLGRGFSWLYFKGRTCGGVWTLLSLEALIPSIYLATQSFSAFYYRLLILAVPTILAWRFIAQKTPRPKMTAPAFRYVHTHPNRRALDSL